MTAAAHQFSTFSHGGAATTWSSKTKTHDGFFLLRNNDLYTCPTHGAGKLIVGTASKAKDIDGGEFFAREGDVTTCGATIVVGTGDSTIDLS